MKNRPSWHSASKAEWKGVYGRISRVTTGRFPTATSRCHRSAFWEHDEAVRRLKAESQREVDENKLVAMVLQQRRLVEEARTKTARRRRGRQPPDDQCTLEADTGRLRVTTAQPNEQDSEIEELKEVAPFPVDIDP